MPPHELRNFADAPVSALQDGRRRLCRPSVQIRPRETRDGEGLFKLFNEQSLLEQALMRGAFANAEEVNLWLNGIFAAKRIELVAVRDVACIGFGALLCMSDHFDHSGALLLGVAESARNQGVGGLILTTLLRTAKQFCGLSKVQLTVLTENLDAISLYQKHGFYFEGLHRRYARWRNRYADAYSMAILLDSDAVPLPTASPAIRVAEPTASA